MKEDQLDDVHVVRVTKDIIPDVIDVIKDGYVRVDIKTEKESGHIKFKKFRITPTMMKRGMSDMGKLAERIDDFISNLWN